MKNINWMLCLFLPAFLAAGDSSGVKLIVHEVSPSLPRLTESWQYISPTDNLFSVWTVRTAGIELIPNTSRILEQDTRVFWYGADPDTAAENLYQCILPTTARAYVNLEGKYTTGGIGGEPPIWASRGFDVDLDMDTDRNGEKNIITNDVTEILEDQREATTGYALLFVDDESGELAVIRKLRINTLHQEEVYLIREFSGNAPVLDAFDSDGTSLFAGPRATRSINLADRARNADYFFHVKALIAGESTKLQIIRKGFNELSR